MTIEQVNSLYDKRKAEITEPAILIRINQAFRYSMTDIELYDYTRGRWKVSRIQAKKAKYAFAVYEGIIQEIYEIIDWFEAGKTFSVRHDKKNPETLRKLEGRFEFIGNIASSLIQKK